MSILPVHVRDVLRRTGLCRYSIALTAAAKPRPIQPPKLSEMPARSDSDVVVLRLGPKPAVEAPSIVFSKPAALPFWASREDAPHTCGNWDASEQDDPFENPPSFWCPACRVADNKRHREATERLQEQPPAAAPVEVPAISNKPTMVTPLQQALIASGGAIGQMIYDEAKVGTQHMRSWAQYALMDDPHFLDVKPVSEEQRKAAHVVRRSVVQMRSVRIKGGNAQEREAECRAWLATPRNKRRAFHKGALVAKDCLPKNNSIIIANVLNDAKTAFGDLRQLLSDHGVVVDMYRPPAPGAPLFVGFHSAEDVNAVLKAFPSGIRYEGRMLPVERAIATSKTSKQMAAGGAAGRA